MLEEVGSHEYNVNARHRVNACSDPSPRYQGYQERTERHASEGRECVGTGLADKAPTRDPREGEQGDHRDCQPRAAAPNQASEGKHRERRHRGEREVGQGVSEGGSKGDPPDDDDDRRWHDQRPPAAADELREMFNRTRGYRDERRLREGQDGDRKGEHQQPGPV